VEGLLARLAADDLAVWDGRNVTLTRRGRLVVDSVGAEVMAAFSKED
jgi:hypothetical protein